MRVHVRGGFAPNSRAAEVLSEAAAEADDRSSGRLPAPTRRCMTRSRTHLKCKEKVLGSTHSTGVSTGGVDISRCDVVYRYYHRKKHYQTLSFYVNTLFTKVYLSTIQLMALG